MAKKYPFLKEYIYYFVIAVSVCILIIPLFIPTIRGTADGFIHKFRIVSFITSMEEGNIRPRWLSAQALGFGTPTFIYNFSVPYYAVTAINTVIHSIQTSFQFYASVVVIVTFISMFILANRLYGLNLGLLTALAYISAPYFLLSLYTYEAWGEMTSFLFPPLILYQAILLTERLDRKRALWFAVLWVLFINTHNCSILESILPIVILIVLYGYRHMKNLIRMFHLLCSSVMISAFFWLPALTLVNWIKYGNLINFEISIRFQQYKRLSDFVTVSINAITNNGSNYYSFTPGLLIIFTLVAGSAVFAGIILRRYILHKKYSDSQLFIAAALFILTVSSILLTTAYSSVLWDTGILNLILYPYRFLFVATFTGTLLFGWLVRKISNIWILTMLCVICVTLSRPFTNPKIDRFPFGDHYFEHTPELLNYGLGTRKNMGTGEFLPNTINMDFLQSQQDIFLRTGKLPEKIILDSKDGTLTGSRILSERMFFDITMNKSADIAINTSYYPNWTARVNSVAVPVSPDANGRILVHLPEGNVRLELMFGYSTAERLGFALSILGVIYLVLILRSIHKPGVKIR